LDRRKAGDGAFGHLDHILRGIEADDRIVAEGEAAEVEYFGVSAGGQRLTAIRYPSNNSSVSPATSSRSRWRRRRSSPSRQRLIVVVPATPLTVAFSRPPLSIVVSIARAPE
jgi:hypothetical protein